MPTVLPDVPIRNRLLAALPAEVYERLQPRLQPVRFEAAQRVYTTDAPLSHVYFPLEGTVALMVTLAGGARVEVATVANEGMLGLPAFFGGAMIPGEALCLVSSRALRLPADVLREQTRTDGPLRDLLQRYTLALIGHIAQSAVCSRLHATDERLARCLLMTQDGVAADRFGLTQAFIAQILGVRRAGVNAAASILQKAGYIRYSRGVITITDRAGLESAVCECYAIVAREYARLFG